MGLSKGIEDIETDQAFSDVNIDEHPEDDAHKRRVRRMIEDRLERKRLKDDLNDELNDEFDWNEVNR